jgi:hypothetical protein
MASANMRQRHSLFTHTPYSKKIYDAANMYIQSLVSFHLANDWMNECMHNGWTTINWPMHCDLQWCVMLRFILHFKWNVGLCVQGHQRSHLVPWKTGPGDWILSKVWPHNHIGYVWLIYLLLGTFWRQDYLSVPVWRGVLLGDSV